MSNELNPRAFPLEGVQYGMSLRDYFAAKAMATLLHDAVLPTKEDRQAAFPLLSQVSYEVADAMLEERNKKL